MTLGLHNRFPTGALAALAALFAAEGAATAAPTATVTLLPSAVEVRSSFSSDGRLEFLVPQHLSDDGEVVGYATDLHRDYGYEVAWYWSPRVGLRAVDPTNGKKPWVTDPGNNKILRSVCQRVVDRTAYCTDDVGDRLYSYSESSGVRILDRGEPEALEVIDRALAEADLDGQAQPIQVVWKAASASGGAGILASNRLDLDSRHPFGVVLTPGKGWRLLSSFEPAIDVGAAAIYDPMFFNRRGDLIFNLAPEGGPQQVYLHDAARGKVVDLGPGAAFNTSTCRNLTDDRRTCGSYFEGDGTVHPRQRVQVPFMYDPAHGVRRIDLPSGLVPFVILSNGELLVSGDYGVRDLVWHRYSPERGRLVRLLTKKRFAAFFPRGTRNIHRANFEHTAEGDLLLLVTGTFGGREITRNFYYYSATDRLVDLLDLIRDATWIDHDARPVNGYVTTRELELVLQHNTNARGETLWLAFLDGRPRVVIVSP